MKKHICLLLCLMLMLSGCAVKDNVSFYYPRVEYIYDAQDGVIAPEKRDITGHRDDLKFLMSLYLMGPLDEALESPFSSKTRLVSVETVDNSVVITLSDTSATLSDSEFILACACLTMTCMDITSADSVTVVSGGRTTTLDPELLTMFDSGTPIETTNGGTQ